MASVTHAGNGGRNRLATEISPYLLQHASNPVDWHPWGPAAFQKAKVENKPIFLSVGYSTCHWCHVMERETFSKESIAAILNKHFVSIKVDREERPDIDRVYMTFLQAVNSSEGGWPMNVWLTPNLHPFHAGTYFPAQDKQGQRSFSAIIAEVARQWEQNRDVITAKGVEVMKSLNQNTLQTMQAAYAIPTPACVAKCFEQLRDQFDVENGGFGEVPKFSQPATFDFLLRLYASNPYSDSGQQALTMTLLTLRKMAEGGVHDHIGNGFHRYSTDKFWHIPHFEKMLYDQAQLCVCYVEAYQITKETFYADIARDILTYIARDLCDPEGGFYSAEDAESLPRIGDSQKREGAFCVWREAEIKQLLPQVVDGTCFAGRCVSFWEVFCHHYGVQANGNVPSQHDSLGDLKQQNVLKVRCTVEETAAHFNIMPDLAEKVLMQSRQVLLDARRLRPRPHRDDKIVTGWNGLAISAFARAGQVLCDDDCVQRGIMAARFIENRMYDSSTGRLKRNSYRHSRGSRELGISTSDAFSPDYAYLIRGLMDLYEVTFDDHWLEFAIQLQDSFDVLFWDGVHGGYYDFAEADPSVLLRLKEDQDGTEPTASSVAASNLLRLAEYTQNPVYSERARATFSAFGQRLNNLPWLLPEMMSAYLFSTRPVVQLCIVGQRYSLEWLVLQNAIHGVYMPFKSIAYLASPDAYVVRRLPQLAALVDGFGPPKVFICAEGSCHGPTNDANIIANLLTPSPPQPTMPNNYTFELSSAVAM